MFPFISTILSDVPLFFFEDATIQGQRRGFGVPRPPYTNRTFRDQPEKPPNLQKMQSVKKSILDFTETQGQYWAIIGEEQYEKQNYPLAIKHFTRAIELTEGTESSFFRYRGQSYKKSGQLDLALKDAIMSIELDDKNIKAHLLCGQILAEKGKHSNNTQDIQTAIVRMTKALTLCAGQKKEYYEQQLSQFIYRAKKLLWYKNQEIVNNKKREAITNYQKYLQSREDLQEQEKKVELEAFINVIGDPNSPLKLDIPSYLICNITLEIMENPVITEAGHAYERDELIRNIQTNGPIDPKTRQPISRALYPDHNLKQAIQEFLLNNPWAFDYTSGENYQDIEF